MSVSDAEFLLWLKDDAQPKVILCHMDYIYEGGSPGSPTVGTLRFADSKSGYVTAATDTPASTPYDDCVLQWPNFVRSLDRQKLGGKVSRSAGTLSLANHDGRNDFMLELACDGSPITFLVGAPTWALADFRTVFSAYTSKLSGSFEGITVAIDDTSLLLNKTIGGDILVGGTGPNKDRSRPINAGYVHSTECVLYDASTQTYFHSDRGSGDPDAPTIAAAIRVRAADVSYADNGDGSVTLAATPDSPIVVAEIQAYQPTKYCISDLIDNLIATRAGLSDAGAWAGPHGSYVRYDSEDFHAGISIVDRKNAAEVMGDLCFTGLAYWGVTRLNQVTYGRIRPTVAYIPLASSFTFANDDLFSLKVDLAKPQFGQINAYGNKRWIVLSDIASGPDLGPTASLSIKGFYYSQPEATGDTYAAAPERYHKTMTPSPDFDTLLSEPSDQVNPPLVVSGDPVVVDQLTTWADVYRRMFLPWLEFVDAVVPFHAYTLEIGDVVTLLKDRYGWDDGALFQAIGIELNLNERPLRVGLGLVRRNQGDQGASVSSGSFLLQIGGGYVLQQNGSKIRIA